MKRRKNALRQAGIYLLLLVISPFVCAAVVRGVREPIEALTVVTTVILTETTATEVIVPIKNTFRIITDDSFIKSDGGLHIPSSRDEESDVPPESKPEENPAEGFGDYPGTDGVVDIVTYGKMSGSSYIDIGGGQIQNLTSLPPKALLETTNNTPFLRDGSPEILIYHTHATESYLPVAAEVFDTNFPFRSTDRSINMVAVGNAMKEELEAAGFGVIHDTTLYDEESYNGSYEASRAGVKKILAENPGIKVVLDVHRDALQKSDSEIVAPTVKLSGKESAQIMIVSNCTSDSLKYPIPDFKENLSLAVRINTEAEALYPGLMRPILFDYRQYNQDLSPGALLIEVGGHGNSLGQAIYAGELFGKALGEALKE
ncbi:MAG: stage II sporulation protein P [Ruminococcus sp.]|jgi:stage II sporulation protein P|nr:stage II sporulation protein P [Ruminococcus sp.]